MRFDYIILRSEISELFSVLNVGSSRSSAENYLSYSTAVK